MRKIEFTAALIVLIGFGLKYFHIQYSGVILVLSLTLLSVFYYALSFAYLNDISFRGIFKKISYRGKSAKRLVGAATLGIALSIVIIGILFKIQFWPMSSFLLIAGLFLLAAILAFATVYYMRTKADFYSKILKRIAIWGILGTGLLFTPNGTLIDVFFRHQSKEYRHLYKEVLGNPNNEELREELYELDRENNRR